MRDAWYSLAVRWRSSIACRSAARIVRSILYALLLTTSEIAVSAAAAVVCRVGELHDTMFTDNVDAAIEPDCSKVIIHFDVDAFYAQVSPLPQGTPSSMPVATGGVSPGDISCRHRHMRS